VAVDRVRATWRIFDRYHQKFLPGTSDNGFDISEVTFASCAISGLHTRKRLHTRNNMSRIFFIAGLLLFLMSGGLIL
jgi:hypothetical protein